MKSINNIVKFYRSCYISDYKAVSIRNFFGKRVSYRYVLQSFEPVSGALSLYPIDSTWGAEMKQALLLHGKEKALYLGAFFLKGKMPVIGRSTSVFVPLFLFEVDLIVEDEIYYIKVDTENPIVNSAFLEYVKSNDGSVSCSYDDLDVKMPKGVLNFDRLVQLKSALGHLFPNLNVESIEDRIKSNFIDFELNAIQKKRTKSYERKLIAGAALGLVDKPKGARGVINELTLLAEMELGTKILKSLFVQPSKENAVLKEREINVPVSLSERQKEVFYSVDNHDITLVIGPPGTGKSFTIAALATELITDGHSVLIASKNSQAGKVIGTKIREDFGLKDLVLETYRRGFQRSLRSRIKRLLHGFSRKKSKGSSPVTDEMIRSVRRKIKELTNLLLKREKEELKWGQFFHQYRGTFFQEFQSKWVEYKYRKSIPIWEIKKKIDHAEATKNLLVKKYMQQKYADNLHKILVKKREEFVQLIVALGGETGTIIHEGFAKVDFNLILKALPAWICNANDVHNILPLKKALFDVVIIDEATQCDIASMIPLMYRAKKIVIVGDPKQLRHVSFLSYFQQGEFRKKYGVGDSVLDYRKNSILDLVSRQIQNQNQVILLDEHYRSMPDIISFSNQAFYVDSLNVMTASPTTILEKSVFVHQVNGQRTPSGKNELEAQKIVDHIRQLVDNQAKVDLSLVESIGIISPFSAQVTLLKSMIRKEIKLHEMMKHNILVGTPFHFQGEERDVIFLSFSVDKNTHPSTYIYLNKDDVFNVSITRARNRQLVFTSVDFHDLNPDYLLAKYLNHIAQNKLLDQMSDEVYDEFAHAIVDLLHSFGVEKIFKSFPVAGVDIDIVVVNKGKTHCIDLIGYPGLFEAQFTPTMIRRLSRMKHNVFFLSYSSWYLEKDKCVSALARFVGFHKNG